MTPLPVDLAVETAAAPDPVGLGGELTYTVTVTNNGPRSVADAMLVDTLPDHVNFVSATGTQTAGGPAGGLKVTVDYTYDTNNFFDTQEKRDLIQAAADSIVGQFGDDLAAITPGGANSWTATFSNPATGQQEEIVDLAVEENELIVFVGGRDLGNAGAAVQEAGLAGPGGYLLPGTSDAAFVDSVTTRGEFGAGLATPSDFGPWGGAITFNMNPVVDFFFGESEYGIGPQENDFFTTALHEMAHLLGFGIVDSWHAYVDDTNKTFLGPASLSVYGGDVPLDANLARFGSTEPPAAVPRR